MHVVVVDDDANTCRALSALLRLANFRVTACQAPEDALALVRTEDPDILVTDYIMDGMSGLELVDASLAHKKSLRCFVVSGHQRPPEEERRHVVWLDKPIDADALLAAIRAE